MCEPTNRERAERARKALMAYSDDVAGAALELASDLVTDILHLMRREGDLDTDDARQGWLLAAARMHEQELDECEED